MVFILALAGLIGIYYVCTNELPIIFVKPIRPRETVTCDNCGHRIRSASDKHFYHDDFYGRDKTLCTKCYNKKLQDKILDLSTANKYFFERIDELELKITKLEKSD